MTAAQIRLLHAGVAGGAPSARKAANVAAVQAAIKALAATPKPTPAWEDSAAGLTFAKWAEGQGLTAGEKAALARAAGGLPTAVAADILARLPAAVRPAGANPQEALAAAVTALAGPWDRHPGNEPNPALHPASRPTRRRRRTRRRSRPSARSARPTSGPPPLPARPPRRPPSKSGPPVTLRPPFGTPIP